MPHSSFLLALPGFLLSGANSGAEITPRNGDDLRKTSWMTGKGKTGKMNAITTARDDKYAKSTPSPPPALPHVEQIFATQSNANCHR